MTPQKKTTTTTKTQTKTTTSSARANEKIISTPLFGKENYKWMIIGVVILAIGFFLMAGGKSSDPNVFNDKDVYSTTRITIAPILIIAGLIIEIFAIMKKPK